jgi:hypothetical protein
MEAVHSSDTSTDFCQTILRHIPDESILQYYASFNTSNKSNMMKLQALLNGTPIATTFGASLPITVNVFLIMKK